MSMASTNFKSLCFILYSIFSFILTHQYHPLDPLTPSELTQVRAIVQGSTSTPHHNLTFHYVGLAEPPKPTILSWLTNHPAKNPPRRAFVIARINHKTHEIFVDLSSKTVTSDKVYTGHGYPMLNFEEQIAAIELSQTYAPFKDSIVKRGLKLEEVVCGSFTIGWYGEKERTNRMAKVMCYYLDGTVNMYMRPIEGMTVIVDLDEMKIKGYYDRLMVPVPGADGTDYRESQQKPPFGPRLKGITVIQPEGPSFTIDGHTVRWANWDFHLSFDMRVGSVISLAPIYDLYKDERRRILNKGFVSELFVPYMDLTDEWYYRTYFDVGEYGLDLCVVSLEPSRDCLENAVFMDGYFIGQDGTPRKISNVFCIFEHHAGDVIWRHTEGAIPGKVVSQIVTCFSTFKHTSSVPY